jgi:hypothetical protein
MRSNTLEEKAMYNRATLLLLLLALAAGAVVPAHADTAHYNVSIDWFDTSTRIVTPLTGFFEIDTSTLTLKDYSIDVPAPFGTVTPNNSQHWLFDQGPACGSVKPCFEIQITQTTYDPYSLNVILLTFGGSIGDYPGGALLHGYGAVSKAQCSDPCQYYASGDATKTAEPASIVLLGCGLALVGGLLRKKLRR